MSTSISLFAGLEPAPVWTHFATLCDTPRASKQESAVRAKVESWARAQGLGVTVDGAGNLILRKPASPGREGSPTVVLQGHLDMVCQANTGYAHDFSRDPIRPVVRDGWVIAEHTTLGADNGMGVSMILAALEDPTLAHGPSGAPAASTWTCARPRVLSACPRGGRPGRSPCGGCAAGTRGWTFTRAAATPSRSSWG